MNWHPIRSVEVRGDQWDMPEGKSIELAQTGESPRFMRRIGNRIEVAS